MTKSRDIANSTSTLDVDGGTIKLDGNYPVGTQNVALGEDTFTAIESGANYNTALGYRALEALTTGDQNTAVGRQALADVTTGSDNTAVGFNAADSTTTGSYNVSVGRDALQANTTASYNTAVGRESLYFNTTGAENSAFGSGSLVRNTTGSYNTGLGRYALALNTTASNNTAVGYQALYDNTTGTQNVAVGGNALDSNTTASGNTAVGYDAASAITTGVYNTCIGIDAGKAITTADSNTMVGRFSGVNTTGTANTFIGKNCGYTVTTGSKNTILGQYNGNQNGLDIRTSSNNIVLSDGDGNPWGYRSGADGNWFFDQTNNNEYTLRVRQTGTGANPYGLAVQYNNSAPNNDSGRFITCSDSSAIRLKVFNNGNVQNQNNSYGSLSDEKLKENIVDSGSQWDDIKALTVRKYSLKEDNLDAPNMLGVIAQEVEAAGMSGLVTESVDEDINNNDLGTVTKAVNYSILYMKAVKALQEAMTRIETLETKVTALEG